MCSSDLTEYYNNWGNELKVPIWPGGIDLKASYDRFVGVYTNPETRTPLNGLAGLGLSIPIGQGLTVTPLQLVAGYAALANGGTTVTPHVTAGGGDGGSGTRVISEGTSDIVGGMLQGVVQEVKGLRRVHSVLRHVHKVKNRAN